MPSDSAQMELEKQRGISVTSTVLQFEYRDTCVNLLDTPGHRDFSEDTYRVLTAVDSVLMVIDGSKGVETQTKKLLEGFRGNPPLDKEAFAEVLVRLGDLGMANPGIREIDINPLIISNGRPIAVDATIILDND